MHSPALHQTAQALERLESKPPKPPTLAADSGSEDTGLAGEWLVGDAENPYRMKRRKNVREGECGGLA